jgi:hypothetical protein
LWQKKEKKEEEEVIGQCVERSSEQDSKFLIENLHNNSLMSTSL